MGIAPGTRLGVYEITGVIGAGGMGEVYRARDTRLNRDVAIKVLPELFAADPDRLVRFDREAQALAALNHPNIAQIYGVVDVPTDGGEARHLGSVALVMEYVDGGDLAQRLSRGALPLDEALPIARQIADALEAAHEQGIIHRDLKPANIKVRPDGTVKVLDFGLAKAIGGESTNAFTDPTNLANSPTITSPMTQMGVILGTAAYMSPEQARGKATDKRADIWAFGAVLFEMLSGRRLFPGETVSDVLAAVLTREPDWTALPPSTPPGVRRLLARCLERDPKRRLRDIGDVRFDLEAVTAGSGVGAPSQSRGAAISWAIAAVGVGVAAFAWFSRTAPSGRPAEVMHLEIGYPADVEPVALMGGGFAISPDGQTVAMAGVRGGVRRVFVRRLDRTESSEVNDTGGVNTVTFSPDSGSIAFVPGNAAVTTLSLADGQRSVVATGADNSSGLGWTPAGLLFTRDGSLWIIPPRGGAARQLTKLDAARHEVLHNDPVGLPGGRSVLFSSLTSDAGAERIEAVSVESGQRSVVIDRATTPVLSPTGHLLFARDGAVLAVAFDPGTATVRGAAVPIMPAGVVATVRSGSLGLQLSQTGTLLFVPTDFEMKRLVSVGRDRAELTLDLPPGRYANPRISPDSKRLLVDSQATTIETLDLARGTHSKLTSAAMGTNFSTWSADGEKVVFRRFNEPYWAAADGSGRQGPMPQALINDYPCSPGPDADSIIEVRVRPDTSGDIFLMSISGKFPPKPLVVTPAYEGGAQLSPDGHWLLYQSNASGTAEIYVRRYPALDRQWQVSEGGGVQARWSATSREIYYRSNDFMMAVAMDGGGAEPVFGKPAPLFRDEYDFGQGITIANYDVTRDGRFIMLRRGPLGGRLHAAVNWTEELKRIIARGGQ